MSLHACKTHLYLMLVMPSSLVARLDCNLYPLQLMPLSLFKKETPHVMLFLFCIGCTTDMSAILQRNLSLAFMHSAASIAM